MKLRDRARVRISKERWHQLGGLRNSKLCREQRSRAGGWRYYLLLD